MSPKGFLNGIKPCSERTGSQTVQSSGSKKNQSKAVEESSSLEEPFKPVLIWTNLISIGLLHIAALWSFLKWGLSTHIYTYMWGKSKAARLHFLNNN